jgi:hypothetical protein
MPKTIRDSLLVGLLLCVPAVIAWVTGQPFIFPSLGPSAFSLVVDEGRKSSARAVIGGHLCGVVCGLLAYNLLAQGLTLSELPPHLSLSLVRLAASGVISVILTTGAMLASRLRHPPACATTLIVSLGLLATAEDALFIMVAVVVMCAVHRVLHRGRRAGMS